MGVFVAHSIYSFIDLDSGLGCSSAPHAASSASMLREEVLGYTNHTYRQLGRTYDDLIGAVQKDLKPLRQAFQGQSAVMLTVPRSMQRNAQFHFWSTWRCLDQHAM